MYDLATAQGQLPRGVHETGYSGRMEELAAKISDHDRPRFSRSFLVVASLNFLFSTSVSRRQVL